MGSAHRLETQFSVYDSLDLGIIIVAHDNLEVTGWNKWVADHSGIASTDAIHKPLMQLVPHLRGSLLEQAIRSALSQSAEAQPAGARIPLSPDRHSELFGIRATLLAASGGPQQCLIQIRESAPDGHRQSLSPERLAKVRTEQALVEDCLLFSHGPIVIIKRHAQTNLPVEYASNNLATELGYEASEWMTHHQSFVSVVHPEDRQHVLDTFQSGLRSQKAHVELEYRIYTQQHGYRWFRESTTFVYRQNGTPLHVTGYLQDITKARQDQVQLETLSRYDSLTGLPNRNYFLEQLDSSMQPSESGSEQTAIILIDLGGFAQLCSQLHHSAGDYILVTMGKRLQRAAPAGGTVARVGGDTFAVAAPIDNEQHALALAKSLQQAVGHTVHVLGQKLSVKCHIGMALRSGNQPIFDIINQADSAKYEAKQAAGYTIRVFNTRQVEASRRRTSFEHALEQAISKRHFGMDFQPIVDRDGLITGVEGLMRWRRSEGAIPPSTFIPVAEQCGHMEALGKLSLDLALESYSEWVQDSGFTGYLSVNISPIQFRMDDFHDWLTGEIKRYRLSPKNILLELTEGTVIDDIDSARGIMDRLKGLGFRFALDDFGIGYASLSQLAQIPIDVLKLDRSFMRGIENRHTVQQLFRGVAQLVSGLDLKLIVEGIETSDHLNFVLSEGNFLGLQGYHLFRPCAPEHIRRLIHCQRENIPTGDFSSTVRATIDLCAERAQLKKTTSERTRDARR